MGYYSETALALTKQGVATLHTKLNSPELSKESREGVQHLLQHTDAHYIHPENGAELWSWGWIKWYPGYYDVDFIEKLMTDLDEGDYYFIRVGEYHDDIEVKGAFEDNPFGMEVSRRILFAEPE